MTPLLSFQSQLEEEVGWYEEGKSGKLPVIRQLTQVGRLLIALRLATGWGGHQAAERLGVSEAQVSRDEENEYPENADDRVQRIIDCRHSSLMIRADLRSRPTFTSGQSR